MHGVTSPFKIFSSKPFVFAFLVGLLFLGGGYPNTLFAQELPQSVRKQLEENGMTPDEARREALRLGIDLSNPEAAVARARQLGVPDALIQDMLNAVAESDELNTTVGADGVVDREVPKLFGRPIITPEVLYLPDADPMLLPTPILGLEDELSITEGDTVLVRVPLKDDLSGIQSVDFFFVDAQQGDTLYAFDVRRVLGSKYEGMWQAMFIVPVETVSDDWLLLVQAIDERGNDNIIDTEEYLRIRRDGEELVDADTVVVVDSLIHFGYDLFAVRPEMYEPTAMGPVDDGYVVGPGDELRLIVFGAAEFQHDLEVDLEGRIFVPNVGQRTVAGSRLINLRDDLRVWLGRSYAGLLSEPPEVLMDLTVKRLRPVNVFVLGEVSKPGRFPLASNSTVFNALYTVGGPRTSGSLRDVQVIRHGNIAYSVDLYEYLLKGFSSGDVQLRSSDNVFIPPRGKTVSIQGEVHRQAIYELREGESFQDLLSFAGGLKAEAYTKRFQIERVVPFESRENPLQVRTVLDFDLASVLRGDVAVPLADGDLVRIFAIPESSNLAAKSTVRAASVNGAVFSPGTYELTSEVRTLKELIEQANGLTGDAFKGKVELYRLTEDLKKQVVSLNLDQILTDVPTQNLVLQPQDSLYIYSMQSLQETPAVRISGQVKTPGQFDLLENMSVVNLLFKGGGLSDSEYLKNVFMDRADLFRKSPDGRTEEIIPFHLGNALAGNGFADELLQPGDEVRIYPLEVEVLREPYVEISGAVKRKGQFRFREGMTLEDLILQAGGFEEGAYLKEVEVTRLDSTRDTNELATSIQVPFVALDQNESPSFGVMTDVDNRMRPARQFELQHLDRIYVRKDPGFREQQVVTVTGEVEFPGTYTLLRENETLTEIIRRAGGVLPTGYPKGGRLVRDNLQVIVEMDKALAGSYDADMVLLPGDDVEIPLQPNTVAVRGNVANEGLIKFEPGRRLTYYLERAGGKRPESESILLTQASGATFSVRRRGLFKQNPVVDEGARILVTHKQPREPGERVDIGRTIVETVGIISSTLTIVVLARQAFN
ncbi:MAG: SLBB domain-containing protein [Rhodothermales bacterium]